MKLSPPKKVTLLLSAVLVVLGIFGTYMDIPYVTGNSLWVMAAGYFLLFLGVMFRGL